MKQELSGIDIVNARIRRQAGHGNIDGEDLTSTEMTELLRGKSLKDVLAARPERKMTNDEIITATHYMNETNCTWADAKEHIRAEALSKVKDADVNTMIRRAAGRLQAEEETK